MEILNKSKRSDLEVIVQFNEKGFIIPRKIRYFDFELAEYKSYNIKSINYIIKEGCMTKYNLLTEDNVLFKIVHMDSKWYFF